MRAWPLCSIVKVSLVWEQDFCVVLWKFLLCVWGEVDTWEYLREAHGDWGNQEHKQASGNLWHFWESPSGATAGERNSSARLSCRKSYMEVQRWSFCKSSSTKNEAASGSGRTLLQEGREQPLLRVDRGYFIVNLVLTTLNGWNYCGQTAMWSIDNLNTTGLNFNSNKVLARHPNKSER